jgi:hypothetical protein
MKFYKLVNEDGLTYFGSTKQELKRRLAVHKCQGLTKRNIRKCTSSKLFENNKKVEIFLVDETDETDKEKLKDMERKFIEENECVNKIKIGTPYKVSKQNWLDKNPHYYRDYQRKNKSTTSEKKYFCECCKIEMLNTSKYRHFKTQEHINKM